jgi:hypothetical protein
MMLARFIVGSPCREWYPSQSAITFRLAPEMIFEAAGLWNNPV